MEGNKLKVGIIGVGYIATKAHIPALLALKDRATIVAIADNRPDNLKHVKERFGIEKAYTDPLQMLAENDLDLVHVCTANATHKEFTIAALRSGAHVLCEKPIALTVKDAKEMFAEADKAGKHLIACQNWRMGPIQEIKKIIDEGKLGDVYYTEVELLRRRGVPPWGRFHVAAENGGGPLCDVGVHYLDAALFALGNPKMKTVSASSFRKLADKAFPSGDMTGTLTGVHPFLPRRDFDYKDFDVEDFAVGMARFDNGMQMILKFSWAVNFRKQDYYRFMGTKAGLEFRKDGEFDIPVVIYGEENGYHTDQKCDIPITRKGAMPDNGHQMLIENYLDVLQKGSECVIKREEILNVVATMEAFYLSAKLGREVSMEELEK